MLLEPHGPFLLKLNTENLNGTDKNRGLILGLNLICCLSLVNLGLLIDDILPVFCFFLNVPLHGRVLRRNPNLIILIFCMKIKSDSPLKTHVTFQLDNTGL